jgi:hypothetical protein
MAGRDPEHREPRSRKPVNEKNMKQAIKFALVVALAWLGIVFHALKPKKRRELPEDHWI